MTLIKNLQWIMITVLVPTLDFSKSARGRALCFLMVFVLSVMQSFSYLSHDIDTPKGVRSLSELCHDTYYGPRVQATIPDPFSLDHWKRVLVFLAVTLAMLSGHIILSYFKVHIMS